MLRAIFQTSADVRRGLAKDRASRPGRRRLRVQQLEPRLQLAAFIVNSFSDTIDTIPGDGEALDASGNTSLRAAVMEANAQGGSHRIELSEGTYLLTINTPAFTADGAYRTDLDIHSQITIVGAGKDKTVIDAGGLFRIFDVHSGASLTLEGVTLTGGHAVIGGDGAHGGAIQVAFGGAVDVRSSVIRDNFGANSGAVAAFGAANFTDVEFVGNRSNLTGGAISMRTTTVTVAGSRFAGNSAGHGGAINATGGTLTITESSFIDNQASAGGGAIDLTTGNSASVLGSTLSGNSAVGDGGAIRNAGANLNIGNSTVSGNEAFRGGGIFTGPASGSGATLVSVHNTIVENRADSGGGIFHGGGTSTLSNSIVALNEAGSGPDVGNGVSSGGGNLIGSNAGGGGFVSSDAVGTSQWPLDPKIGPLADNGGPTQTHALRRSSPAIDGGVGVSGFGTDQRGKPRPAGAARDIGSYEVQPEDPATNLPPVAIDDSYGIDENLILAVDAAMGVLANDEDPDDARETLIASLVSGPQNGTLQLNPDGSFVYEPNPGFYGDDAFVYQVTDPWGALDTATVSLTVSVVNQAPVAIDDRYDLTEDHVLEVAAPGVLANDTDREGDTMAAILVEGPRFGTLQLNADGSFVYQPNQDYFGIDSFTYRASDGKLLSEPATVTLIVQAAEETIEIDILPDDPTNTIDLATDGWITVAILGRDDFNVQQIDIASLRFGKTGTESSVETSGKGRAVTVVFELKDISDNGHLDLVVRFETKRTNLGVGDTHAILSGSLQDGQAFAVSQEVTVISTKKGGGSGGGGNGNGKGPNK
ncbi:MAG TPA: hypothetical protein DDZ51_06580 [Planctomycetaceae bacterium]|nr:hypothetical protein [Planctomycetaceae bacterium]